MEINHGLLLETELRLGLPGAKKRGFSQLSGDVAAAAGSEEAENKNPAVPVVGWPPIGEFRRKNSSKKYVKVSMDGAPFLRKIDLSVHKGYSDLLAALGMLFGCFDQFNMSCEVETIYEDNDEDWMLLGDVPWGMFIESCKRIRIMKTADAMGMKLRPKDLLKALNKPE